MFKGKEVLSILIISVIFAFIFSFSSGLNVFMYFLGMVFLVVILNFAGKKATSYYLDSEIETGFWEIKRYGFKPHHYFNKGLPSGLLLPVLTSLVSLGNFVWMASLTFEVKAKVYRAAKRFGLYSFSEMTEYHMGLIAASGIFVNLILALAGYLAGFSEFAKISIYYAFFNMIPISDLDGNKVFFGSFVLWSFLEALVLIGIGYVFLGI